MKKIFLALAFAMPCAQMHARGKKNPVHHGGTHYTTKQCNFFQQCGDKSRFLENRKMKDLEQQRAIHQQAAELNALKNVIQPTNAQAQRVPHANEFPPLYTQPTQHKSPLFTFGSDRLTVADYENTLRNEFPSPQELRQREEEKNRKKQQEMDEKKAFARQAKKLENDIRKQMQSKIIRNELARLSGV